jgi:hypothetical protein
LIDFDDPFFTETLAALRRFGLAAQEITDLRMGLNRRRRQLFFHPLFPLSKTSWETVRKIGRERSWTKRFEFGYAENDSVFKFVETEYKYFIPAITQSHLRIVDRPLYDEFTKQVAAVGLPFDLDVPTKEDAELRKLPRYERAVRALARKPGQIDEDYELDLKTAPSIKRTLSIPNPRRRGPVIKL